MFGHGQACLGDVEHDMGIVAVGPGVFDRAAEQGFDRLGSLDQDHVAVRQNADLGCRLLGLADGGNGVSQIDRSDVLMRTVCSL